MPPRGKNSLVAEGDVSVQKVEKIEPVYNLVTRPSVYANPRAMTVLAWPPSAGQKKVFQKVQSKQEIDEYIEIKKRQFAGEIPQGTWFK